MEQLHSNPYRLIPPEPQFTHLLSGKILSRVFARMQWCDTPKAQPRTGPHSWGLRSKLFEVRRWNRSTALRHSHSPLRHKPPQKKSCKEANYIWHKTGVKGDGEDMFIRPAARFLLPLLFTSNILSGVLKP